MCVQEGPAQFVVAGGSSRLRQVVADELRRSGRVDEVGVVAELDHSTTEIERITLVRVATTARVKEPLSPRELEVLSLLVAGRTTTEICASLFVSVDTVKTHVRHLFHKLGVNDRRSAARRAHEIGIATTISPHLLAQRHR